MVALFFFFSIIILLIIVKLAAGFTFTLSRNAWLVRMQSKYLMNCVIFMDFSLCQTDNF